MNRYERAIRRCVSAFLVAVALLGCQSPRLVVVGEGLTNPRTIAVDADGTLLVAEAGTGVDDGRITRLAPNGARTTVADRLPSFPYTPKEIVGPAAVRPLGRDLYWIQGLGRDERRSGALLRLRDGNVEVLASLRLAARSAPDGDTSIANPFDLIVEPDGTVYVSDASTNVIWRVDIDRRVSVHLQWTAIQDPVPTGLARGPDGAFYVALFSPEPHAGGSGAIVRFDATGERSTVVDHLTTPIAVAFDRAGAMLVLELSSGFAPGPPPGFAPCSGRLLRITGGRRALLADRLDRPTDVAVGPDGLIYVTLVGAFGATGSGRIVRLPEPRRYFDFLSPSSRSGRCLS